MKAAIILQEMQYEVKIGVEEVERQFHQPILFDMEFQLDITNAVENQNITETINYSGIQKSIGTFLGNKEYVLLEKLTSDIVEFLLQQFPKIEELSLTCWKPHALEKKNVKNVGIKITKIRE